MKKIQIKLIEFAKKLNSRNLSPLRSGNISVRFKKNSTEGFLITPSGIKYERLKTNEIVFVSLGGKFDRSGISPSSEWKFHQDIYLKKRKANAIVHSHSPYATALSTFGKSIPAFHYMVALAGGNNIKCAKYATFGTRELSKNIIYALENRQACLIANHGQVGFGENLCEAFELSEEIENICYQYSIALTIGRPNILSSKEMKNIMNKMKDYKK